MSIDQTILYHRKGLSDATVGTTRIKKDIIASNEWEAAKIGDDLAAQEIVQQAWNYKKTDVIREELKNKKTVFISQPSTTATNIIPIILAEHLADQTNSTSINGDEFYDSIHSEASKGIPRDKRVFRPREYEGVNLEILKNEIGNRQVFIVEDILNTGGSVRAFSNQLNKDGFEVVGIIALMGDRRLSLDQKTVDRLNNALENQGIDFKADNLQITRLEAGGLIRMTNQARSENAKKQLTRNLQGLQDRQTAYDLGRDQQQTRGDNGLERGNKSNAKFDQGIPADSRTSEEKIHHVAGNRHNITLSNSYRITLMDSGENPLKTRDITLPVGTQNKEELRKALKGEVKSFSMKSGLDLSNVAAKVEIIDKPKIEQLAEIKFEKNIGIDKDSDF